MTDTARMMILGAVVLALVMSACEPQLPDPPVEVPEEVEVAAREALSRRTGIPVEAMHIVDAERRDWPDSCLGLGEPDEACLTVITSGWRITIRAEGARYVLRTDEDGREVRME